ncbi:hypothetical protein OG586_37320 [Streptomyces murinus]|uniref:hypothetical protein n=1 Tax=Streptomyces murinus TaxID=33900 RepID=UPI002E80323F|nr:hypothetical protein [Streptomyces murinus]WUD04731.1 hypothetical protein OG586_00130 [Streptomyces murinus]WUD11496.1 hypothetical protein OG586_37320 [Streptomyces murinus]
MLGARDGDGLLGAEEVSKCGVDELRGIAEFAPLGSCFVVAGDRSDLASLVGVVRRKQTVGSQTA